MNKGFFVVFLAVVAGAMGLIFLNHTSRDVSSQEKTVVAQNGVSVGVPSQDARGAAPASPRDERQPESSAPGSVSRMAEPREEQPASAKPVSPQSPAAKPEAPKPESPKPAVKPEAPKPEAAKPEAPKPAPSKPEAPAPVKPEQAQPEAAAPVQTQPVSSKPETAAPAESPRKSLTLVNIGLHFKGAGMALRIEADGPFSYKTFVLPAPDRYVVDLVGTWQKMRVPSVPSNTMIKSARAGQQASGPRLVLDMLRVPKKHNVSWVAPNILEIYIE